MGTSPPVSPTDIEARTIGKVRNRIVPFSMILMVIASLDRTNIGFDDRNTETTQQKLLDEFDFARLPSLVEPRWQWTIKAQDKEKAFMGDGLNPVALLALGGFGCKVNIV